MRIARTIAIAVATLAAIVVVVGFLLPSRYSVSRSTVIDAPADRVYALIAAPSEWPKWTVWNERDPAMKITYSGPPSGQGAGWAWESKSEGTGSMQFTAAEPSRRVEYVLTFPEFDMRSRGALTLLPEGKATRVTWTNAGEVGPNPLMHYMAALMDRMAGPDFEKGLANLKARAEKP
jgi:uncharacterized protein YndB with AHSA1/START domain